MTRAKMRDELHMETDYDRSYQEQSQYLNRKFKGNQ